MSWFGKLCKEDKKDDYCSCFPEYWCTWKFKKIYIGWMCKKHDERCGSHEFYRDTWEANLIGAVLIATVASIACWVKYWVLMRDKV